MKHAAGLVLVRRGPDALRFLLVHPGGPFFVRRDEGVWSIPKGIVQPNEPLLVAARREFGEETGWPTPDEGYLDLGEVRQSRKTVRAWAFVGDADPATVQSNTFPLEWPPRSGKFAEFPEVDRAAFYTLTEAGSKIVAAQLALLERAAALLGH